RGNGVDELLRGEPLRSVAQVPRLVDRGPVHPAGSGHPVKRLLHPRPLGAQQLRSPLFVQWSPPSGCDEGAIFVGWRPAGLPGYAAAWQVRVRVTPSTVWILVRTTLPRSPRLSASTSAITSHGPVVIS